MPASSYEAVPYVSRPFTFTNPLKLQTLGKLFGLNAPDACSCRVLEIGCGSAANILAMAASLPGSRFVGIDSSEAALVEGRAALAESKLTNVELLKLDIAEVGEGQGKFDYIVCHGVFSWISRELQNKVLEICRSLLTPEGVAYISYNTLPGWHPRLMIREMLVYHAEPFRDSEMYLDQARAMTTLLEKGLKDVDAPLAVFMKNSLKQIREYPDWVLRHDVLEDINEPLFFHRFAEMLEPAGLQYLGDADLPKMVDVGFSEEVRRALRIIAEDIIRFEQYLDFLWNRVFRRSLVCRKEVKLTRELAPSRVQECFLVSALKPAALSGEDVQRFENADGGTLETNDPFVVEALKILGAAWPESVSFSELFARAEAVLKDRLPLTAESREAGKNYLAQSFWNLAIRDLVELLCRPWPG